MGLMNKKQPLSTPDIIAQAPSVMALGKGPTTSERYHFVNTINIVDQLRTFGWEPIQAYQRRVRMVANADNTQRQSFTMHHVIMRPGGTMQLAKGEVIPFLNLVNSHDGKSSLQIHLGLYRTVCDNQLVVGQETFKSIRVTHHSFNAQKINDEIVNLMNFIPELDKTIDEMKSTELNEFQCLRLAQYAHILKYGEVDKRKSQKISTALDLLKSNRAEDNSNNLWVVYNRIQENLLQGGYNGMRVVRAINKKISYNQKLWDKAVAMVVKP
jgi:Domain of unknown function (DUF932)